MNYGIHWKLWNIPRRNELWLQAIADSIYRNQPTISRDPYRQEHVASTAMELPERDLHIVFTLAS